MEILEELTLFIIQEVQAEVQAIQEHTIQEVKDIQVLEKIFIEEEKTIE